MRKHATVLTTIVTLVAGIPAQAGEGEWILKLQPVVMQAHGHDQHVLTIREVDEDPTPAVEENRAVNLETNSNTGYHLGLEHRRGRWSFGLDFLWLNTSQKADTRALAADGPAGTLDEIVFEIADRSYVSEDPAEVLFYEVLEDTDLAFWTLDLFAARALTDDDDGDIHVLFGLRTGDFDNDYRAVVGLQDVAGTRIDASSNYDRMMGPLVGLSGEVRCGRNRFGGTIVQSVLMGSVELTGASSDFDGPFGLEVPFTDRRILRRDLDAAIPITDFRLEWTYEVSRRIAVGLGANTSAWWDVPVPPGVIPGEGGSGRFHENTIVFFGMQGAVVLKF